jgi:hypothetical protein
MVLTEILWRYRELRTSDDDIHTKLMNHYLEVPQWRYLVSLTTSIDLSIFVCKYYGTDLPWWSLLLAVGLAALFLLPIGIITAISNQTPGFNIIIEFGIRFIMLDKPIVNVTFKTYGYIGMMHAISSW